MPNAVLRKIRRILPRLRELFAESSRRIFHLPLKVKTGLAGELLRAAAGRGLGPTKHGDTDLGAAGRYGTSPGRLPARPRFAVVLLQYKGLDHTLRCVESLLANASGVDLRIVVVDNFSSQELADATAAALENRDRVTLLLRSENDGYASGNNHGFRWAKEHLSPDFIGVFNNDVLVQQPDFFARCVSEYRRRLYSVLGPDILVRHEGVVYHQNPFFLKPKNQQEVRHRLSVLGTPTDNGTPLPGRPKRTPYPVYGPLLHGAALVFSPLFLFEFEEPFDGRTFLYNEEHILHVRALARGHRMIYSPDVRIVHNTVLRDYKNDLEFRDRRAASMRNSLGVLLEWLDDILPEAGRKE